MVYRTKRDNRHCSTCATDEQLIPLKVGWRIPFSPTQLLAITSSSGNTYVRTLELAAPVHSQPSLFTAEFTASNEYKQRPWPTTRSYYLALEDSAWCSWLGLPCTCNCRPPKFCADIDNCIHDSQPTMFWLPSEWDFETSHKIAAVLQQLMTANPGKFVAK